jgi:hypothetical protein
VSVDSITNLKRGIKERLVQPSIGRVTEHIVAGGETSTSLSLLRTSAD